MREMTEEQVYAKLDERTKAKYDKFDEDAGKCIMGLDKVGEKANALVDLRKYADQSELNQLLQALRFLVVSVFVVKIYYRTCTQK